MHRKKGPSRFQDTCRLKVQQNAQLIFSMEELCIKHESLLMRFFMIFFFYSNVTYLIYCNLFFLPIVLDVFAVAAHSVFSFLPVYYDLSQYDAVAV